MNVAKVQELSTIYVAIDFDENLKGIIENGINLARQWNCRLNLVHVVDPWDGRWIGQFSELSRHNLDTLNFEELLVQAAKDKMGLLKSQIPSGILGEAKVVLGDVVQGLLRTVKETESELLLVGVSKSL